VQQFASAWRGRLDSRFSTGSAEREAGPWVVALSRFGIAARACVFAGVGVLLLRLPSRTVTAARHTDTTDSLRWFAGLPSGRWVLAAVALGLAAYGVYQVLHARYRRIVAP